MRILYKYYAKFELGFSSAIFWPKTLTDTNNDCLPRQCINITFTEIPEYMVEIFGFSIKFAFYWLPRLKLASIGSIPSVPRRKCVFFRNSVFLYGSVYSSHYYTMKANTHTHTDVNIEINKKI